MEHLVFTDDKTQQWLLDILRTSIVKVTFEKVDKSIRVMEATLSPEHLPKIIIEESSEPKEVKPRKESTTAFYVFDVEKQEFRAIRWSSITHIEFEL